MLADDLQFRFPAVFRVVWPCSHPARSILALKSSTLSLRTVLSYSYRERENKRCNWETEGQNVGLELDGKGFEDGWLKEGQEIWLQVEEPIGLRKDSLTCGSKMMLVVFVAIRLGPPSLCPPPPPPPPPPTLFCTTAGSYVPSSIEHAAAEHHRGEGL